MRTRRLVTKFSSRKLQPISRIALCALCFTSLFQLSMPPRPLAAASPDDAEKQIEEIIRASIAESVAAAFHDLETGKILINPDRSSGQWPVASEQ